MTDPGTVVHVSTTDGAGGAARAARRLHDGLVELGWDSRNAAGARLVGAERSVGLATTARAATAPVDRVLRAAVGFVGERRFPYPGARAFDRSDLFRSADVINLHNLHGGYFDYAVLPRWTASKPVVWTLHDMWALTGHCAYSFECERWVTGCHDCPMWHEWRERDEIPRTPWDNSRAEWRRKRRTYERSRFAVVAPSRWLADLAERSIVARSNGSSVHHIPYGLDLAAYQPMDRAGARASLALDPEAPIVLFSAASIVNGRKGIADLAAAVQALRADYPALRLITMGSAGRLPPGLDDLTVALGDVTDSARQRAAYAAADAVALPSRADNQPLVMLEALACGVPVVAADVGGIPETVRDGETGLLTPPADPPALARTLALVLGDAELGARLGGAGREHAEREHDLARQAARYGDLYRELAAAARR